MLLQHLNIKKIVARLHQILYNAIDKSKCTNCVVYGFVDLKISEDKIFQPDTIVACKPFDQFIDFPHAIVFEVLSPATALKDRNTKFVHYQAFKVPSYVIINIEKEEIENYTLKNKGKYELADIKTNQLFTFLLEDRCKLKLNFKVIWK